MSRDIFMKKNARSTRGASTAGIWSSQFSIIPPNRERIPFSDLRIGCREAKFWIEDSTIEGRKERFVESPFPLPKSPFSPLFQINHTTRRCFGIRFSNFNSTRPRTRPDPFHAILADNSTVRSRDDHPRFPAPRYPCPSPFLTNRSVLSSKRVDVVSVAACCVAN